MRKDGIALDEEASRNNEEDLTPDEINPILDEIELRIMRELQDALIDHRGALSVGTGSNSVQDESLSFKELKTLIGAMKITRTLFCNPIDWNSKRIERFGEDLFIPSSGEFRIGDVRVILSDYVKIGEPCEMAFDFRNPPEFSSIIINDKIRFVPVE